MSEAEQARVRKIIADHNQMNLELGDLRIETIELARLATVKADESEQKARDLRAARTRYIRIVGEIKTKKLQIQEYEKSLKETLVSAHIDDLKVTHMHAAYYYANLMQCFFFSSVMDSITSSGTHVISPPCTMLLKRKGATAYL